MLSKPVTDMHLYCRSPHGERGLKYGEARELLKVRGSLPARGAWIEIVDGDATPIALLSRSPHGERGLKFPETVKYAILDMSLPARGAWIEIFRSHFVCYSQKSLPARGAWIEICEYLHVISFI